MDGEKISSSHRSEQGTAEEAGEGHTNVKDSPKRVAAERALLEKGGAKWHEIYYMVGEYDFVASLKVLQTRTQCRRY